MARLLSKDHFRITNGDKILTLNKIAINQEKKGEKVINATVGMLYDENKKLVECHIINDMSNYLSSEEIRKYGSANGGLDFKESVEKWLFGETNLGNCFVETIATFGATGALSLSMRNYANREQEILLPSIRWSNYDSIVSQVGCNIKEYNLFNSDDTLDLESIKRSVEYSIEKYQRVYILINDPCQNPTGYTLSLEEWENLLSYLSEKSLTYPIVLLDDIAYLNYSDTSYDKVFELFVKYINDNFMIHVTFSASKTLSIYGYRGGALIALSNNKSHLNDFKEVIESSIRGSYSMPNNLTCKIISKAFENIDIRNKIKSEIEMNRKMLKQRADLFFDEANMVDLVSYPYLGGFFVLIPCDDEDTVCQKLIKKNIFVVPMASGLRISLSSLTLNEIKGLAKQIKQALK